MADGRAQLRIQITFAFGKLCLPKRNAGKGERLLLGKVAVGIAVCRGICLRNGLQKSPRLCCPAGFPKAVGNGCGIQTLICPEGILQGSPVLGKRRRIHNHQIIFPLRDSFQILHRITAQRSMPVSRIAVESDIPVHKSHCLSRTVDRNDRGCSSG